MTRRSITGPLLAAHRMAGAVLWHRSEVNYFTRACEIILFVAMVFAPIGVALWAGWL